MTKRTLWMSQMKIVLGVNTIKTFHRHVAIRTSAPMHSLICLRKLASLSQPLRPLVKLTEEEATDTKIGSIQSECKAKRTIRGST